ncbi:MAG: hypothetical protein V7L20_14180 [Nostoc sp.]|uniref:hypothetical protein n=1 Tax=Nostoc sp. TaxID=1180 RepID=UPI002FF564C7
MTNTSLQEAAPLPRLTSAALSTSRYLGLLRLRSVQVARHKSAQVGYAQDKLRTSSGQVAVRLRSP